MERINIKNQYKDAFNYIKEIRNYIYLGMIIFLVGGIIGFIFMEKFTFFFEFFQEIKEKTKNLNTFELIIFIFKNNLSVSLWGFFGGFLFAIVPAFILLSNGIIMGSFVKLLLKLKSISVLWWILPHGIFELPAFFISLGLGLRLFSALIISKKITRDFKKTFYNSINVFLFIIFPFLLVAAIIESLLIAII